MLKSIKRFFVIAGSCLLIVSSIAHAETSIYELRITNNSSSDLRFELQDGHSKNVDLTFNKSIVDSHTIKAGTSGTVGIKPDGDKCTPTCGAGNPAYGKVYAFYKDSKGVEQRNNYYKATVEFYEYCGVSGTKPVTSYTSNWRFDHGGGQGTNHINHNQSSSHNSYTKSEPSQGLTLDAKYIHGHATITYSDKKN